MATASKLSLAQIGRITSVQISRITFYHWLPIAQQSDVRQLTGEHRHDHSCDWGEIQS